MSLGRSRPFRHELAFGSCYAGYALAGHRVILAGALFASALTIAFGRLPAACGDFLPVPGEAGRGAGRWSQSFGRAQVVAVRVPRRGGVVALPLIAFSSPAGQFASGAIGVVMGRRSA